MEALWGLVGVALGALGVYFLVVPALKVKAAANESAAAEKIKLETQLAEREATHAKVIEAYADAEQKLKDSFDSISLKNLKLAIEEHKKLADGDIAHRQKLIEETLKPFQERLKELDGHNRDIEKQRAEAYGELLQQIKTLGEQQSGLTKETNRLVKALQDPGSAGAWGEMVLERVVEMAGLEEHYSFDQQSTCSTEDGNQRPDMHVHLPGDRLLIIDSKAVMRLYFDGLDTTDEEMRASFFRSHAGKLLEHAKELKKRDYSKNDKAPDFTVMFIPSESAFRTAVEARHSLIEECMECNVVLATPTTLLALLRAVNYGWQQDKLAQLAKEVQKDGAQLYNKIADIVDDYLRLGRALKTAGTSYDDFGKTLEAGVLITARKFKDNGVQTNKEIAAIEPIHYEPRELRKAELKRQSALGFSDFGTASQPQEVEQER